MVLRESIFVKFSEVLKFFIYQMMHNRVALKEYLNLHYNSSYMFRFNHHHQGSYCLSLLKL